MYEWHECGVIVGKCVYEYMCACVSKGVCMCEWCVSVMCIVCHCVYMCESMHKRMSTYIHCIYMYEYAQANEHIHTFTHIHTSGVRVYM